MMIMLLLNILRDSYLGGVVVSFADVSVAHYLYWMIRILLNRGPPYRPLPSRGPQGQAIVAKVSKVSKVVTEHGRAV